jgi:hypothetical protein
MFALWLNIPELFRLLARTAPGPVAAFRGECRLAW